MKLYLLTLILCLMRLVAFTQSPYIQQYTDREGVPGMVVYQVLQDDNGLIWLTTDNGIAYFDGNKFTTVTHPKMKGLDFIGLYKAPNGRIWFWNWSGQVFYLHKNKIEYYSPNGFLDNQAISTLFSDKAGNVWLGKRVFNRKLLMCDDKGNCSERASFGTKNFLDFLNAFTPPPSNQTHFVWLDSYTLFTDTGGKESTLIEKGIIAANKQLGLVFVTKNTPAILYSLSFQEDTLAKKEVLRLKKGQNIRDIYCDNHENIWVLSSSHLYLFDKNRQPQPINIPFIEEALINSIIQDKHGGYWMGTKGEGLIYIPNINLITFSKENSILDSDNIISTISNNEKTFLATETGDITTIDNTTFEIQSQKLNTGLQYVYKRPNGEGFFFVTGNNTLEVDKEIHIKKKYNWGILKCITEVNDTIAIASSTGVGRITKTQYNDYPLSTNQKKLSDQVKTLLVGIPTYSLYTQNDTLYSGTIKGLFICTKNDTLLQFDFSDNPIINDAWVQDIVLDSINNILWLATNQGLHGLKNGKLFQSFTTKNGLSDDNCNYIQFDKKNRIWIGTHQGVNIINTQTGEIDNVNLSNGLPSNRITSLSLNDTQAWVGTPKGVVYFKQIDILKANPLFPVSIVNIKINGRDTVLLDSYTFDYEDNNCVISFVSPSFENENEKLTYHYRLHGLNNNWVTTISTTIPYTNLPAGEYTFEVYATNEKGLKSAINKEISIIVLKPFWQKWWFLVIAFLLSMVAVAVITSLIFRNYTKRREEKLNFQRELSESKIKALQAQMNPHFIFNALNAIQFFFTTNSKELAMLHLNKFAKLIRLIFEYSKETTISLHQEIKFLKLYLELEKLRFDKKINIEYTIDEALEKDANIPPLLIQPIIENSFKHGLLHKEGQGSLKVLFQQKTPTTILCIIEDDGVGRAAAKAFRKEWAIEEYRSSGVHTIMERIKLFNQNDNPVEIAMEIIDLKDNAGQACGTKTIFTFELDELFFE